MITGAIGFAVILGTAVTAWACFGTPRPPTCSQTIWLAKLVDEVEIYPGEDEPIDIEIGMLTFVSWDNISQGCAQPSAASYDLTLSCTPPDGGDPIVIGPMTFAAATPMTPGLQGLTTITFTIPAGTLEPEGPYECLVMGEYDVTFGPGIGAGLLTGAGDTHVCIVPPAVDEPDIPRFHVACIPTNGAFHVCRKGDQARSYYLLENNSDESLSLDLSLTSNQVARTPGGANADNTFFAIADPLEGTDNFPVSLNNGDELLMLPDPLEVSDQEVTDTLSLDPWGIDIVWADTRSYGMCANGSCSETFFRATGMYAGGDDALGCANTALVVDDVPAKSPLCEVTDEIKSAPNVDSQYSIAIFDDADLLSTHAAGNLFDDQGGPGTQITGEQLRMQFDQDFPSSATDTLRTEIPPMNVRYTVQAFPANNNFAEQNVQVHVNNLPESGSIAIPLIARENGTANFSVMVDAGSGQTTVTDRDNDDEELYDGPLDSLMSNPPMGIVVDPETCRTFSCSGIPDEPTLGSMPKAAAELYAGATPSSALRHTFQILDPFTDTELSWTATSDNAAVSLESSSGVAGDMLVAIIDPDAVANSPDTTIAKITVTNDSTLNKTIVIPIAARKTDDFMLDDGGGTDDDSDGDGIADDIDNCPNIANADQADQDGDGFGDVCDPFPTCANCTPMGMISYLTITSLYGGALFARRRKKAIDE